MFPPQIVTCTKQNSVEKKRVRASLLPLEARRHQILDLHEEIASAAAAPGASCHPPMAEAIIYKAAQRSGAQLVTADRQMFLA